MRRYKCLYCGGEFDAFDYEYMDGTGGGYYMKKCPFCGHSFGGYRPQKTILWC